MIKANMIANCPVTINNINLAEKICGMDIATLKGKTVRKKPEPVVIDHVSVPKDILKTHPEVTIAADIMFVQSIPFFVTISHHIKFTTIEKLASRSSGHIKEACDNVIKLHSNRGFKV